MKTMKVGIVGAGFIAYKHTAGIKEFDNVEFAGVADVDEAKQKALIEQFGGKAYESFEQMLIDPEIDIIDICLPTQLHYDFAMKTIDAGKALFLEKPMALNYADSKKIVEHARSKKVPVMVGQSLRFKSEYMTVKDLVDSGKLGEIKQVYAARLGQRPSWRKWSNNANNVSGALYDLSLHDIDYLYSLFGDVESVYCTGAYCEGYGYEDVFCTMNFQNGVKALVDTSQTMTKGYPFTMILRVDGTLGTAEYRFTGGENTEICSGSALTLYMEGKDPEIISCDNFSNHGKELSYFAQCIETGEEPMLCYPEDTVAVMNILELISQSLLEKRIVGK